MKLAPCISTTAPLLVNLDEAARLLGVSRYTLNNWARAGKIPSVLLGARRLLETAELTRLIDEGRKAAAATVKRAAE